mgnify:CR=1 FL=1
MGFFSKLFSGLKKTKDSIASKINAIFVGELDDDFYEELEFVLVSSDISVEASSEIVENVKNKSIFDFILKNRCIIFDTNPDYSYDIFVENKDFKRLYLNNEDELLFDSSVYDEITSEFNIISKEDIIDYTKEVPEQGKNVYLTIDANGNTSNDVGGIGYRVETSFATDGLFANGYWTARICTT